MVCLREELTGRRTSKTRERTTIPTSRLIKVSRLVCAILFALRLTGRWQTGIAGITALDPSTRPGRATRTHALRRSQPAQPGDGPMSVRDVPATVHVRTKPIHPRLLRAARLPTPGSFAFPFRFHAETAAAPVTPGFLVPGLPRYAPAFFL